MVRPSGFAIALTTALVLGHAVPAGQASAETATDANIVTGLDISDSVSAAEARGQIAGMAAAVRSPELLAAIRRGREGRVGFAVFAWHHHRFAVVPWMLVASAADAEAVAQAIEARFAVDIDAEVRVRDTWRFGRLTDLSRALDHAGALLAAAPFATGRAVVNIVGNGSDNMGEPAANARDRLLAGGASVNGVVAHGDRAVLDYYRREVTGGAGAFVLAAEGGEAMAELMRRKFLRDLTASAD